MASIVSICNQALSEIGTQSAIADLMEASAEAQQCSLWYDDLRKRLLRTAQWGFARRQIVLTQLGDAQDHTASYPYLFKYAYPSDALKIRYLLAPPLPPPSGSTNPPVVGVTVPFPFWMFPSRANRFMVASDVDAFGASRKVILSNVCAATAVYTADEQNPDLFDDLFSGALASALAYKLCIPLSGNIGQRQQFAQSAQAAILEARAADGNEAVPSSDITVDWITTRGCGSPWGAAGFANAGGSGWGSWYNGNENMSWGS